MRPFSRGKIGDLLLVHGGLAVLFVFVFFLYSVAMRRCMLPFFFPTSFSLAVKLLEMDGASN